MNEYKSKPKFEFESTFEFVRDRDNRAKEKDQIANSLVSKFINDPEINKMPTGLNHNKQNPIITWRFIKGNNNQISIKIDKVDDNNSRIPAGSANEIMSGQVLSFNNHQELVLWLTDNKQAKIAELQTLDGSPTCIYKYVKDQDGYTKYIEVISAPASLIQVNHHTGNLSLIRNKVKPGDKFEVYIEDKLSSVSRMDGIESALKNLPEGGELIYDDIEKGYNALHNKITTVLAS